MIRLVAKNDTTVPSDKPGERTQSSNMWPNLPENSQRVPNYSHSDTHGSKEQVYSRVNQAQTARISGGGLGKYLTIRPHLTNGRVMDISE